MISTQNIEITFASDAFYIESSLPAGATITEYRRSRPRRPTLWQRLAHRSRG
jgi:hypothetical protein